MISMKVKAGDNGKRFSKELKKKINSNLFKERVRRVVDLVATEANRITPVDTGATRDSQRKSVETTANRIVGLVYYDPSIRTDDGEYMRALLVHELAQNYRNGQSKFLEKTVVNNRDKIVRILRGQE